MIGSELFYKSNSFSIYDTAGIRETSNVIEKKGVDISVSEIQNADLVLGIFENNTPDEIDLNEIDISKIDASRYKIKKIAERLELDEYIQENDNGLFSKINDESSYNTTSVQPLLMQARGQYQEVKDFLESDQCLMSILLTHFN